MKLAWPMAILGIVLSQAAFAVPGSWSQKTAGGTISVGQQIMQGAPLVAPESLSAMANVSQLSWKITLLSPQVAGLEIKLCTPATCIKLDRLNGQKVLSTPLSARGPFRFIYSVSSKGQLAPAVHVVSNQLTVNYR